MSQQQQPQQQQQQPMQQQPMQPGYQQPGQQPMQPYNQAYQQPGQPPMQPYAQGGVYQQPGQPYVQGMPVQNIPGQPAPVVWMQSPGAITGCPPGLEYLTQVDQLLVKQQVEIMELLTGWEAANKYKVLNNVGQQVYFAAEESDMCMRQCCGPNRGFCIHITDNMGQEVIKINREFKCCAGCCWCANLDACGHEVAIEAPVGQVIGYVRQERSGWTPHFSIQDANHEVIFTIKGPCCICQGICCTADQEFIVYSKDMQTEVGKVSKQWTGLMREMFTDADNFGVTFPMDLDVKMKAVMIAAVFLIDFMFFEQKQNNNRRY